MSRHEEFTRPTRHTPTPPSPSSSIILVSPTNTILLLSRLQTSSSFPSAHVFPGGNLEASDGPIAPSGVARHTDNLSYRTGAIRELFEESGILLARENRQPNAPLLALPPAARNSGRHAIHTNNTTFQSWLTQQSPTAILDTNSLIPFTHWITPPNVKKRYTTQMYIYFIPTTEAHNDSIHAVSDEIETTAAEWLPASTWLEKCRAGDVILFPPQYLLLHLVAGFLDADGPGGSKKEIETRRSRLTQFINAAPPAQSSSPEGVGMRMPAWRDKFISPLPVPGIPTDRTDGRIVLGLDTPGLELKESGLQGEYDRVILVKFVREGTRELEVRWRRDLIREHKEARGEEMGEGKKYGVGVEGFTVDDQEKQGKEGKTEAEKSKI